MVEAKKFMMTPNGIKKLEDELEFLKTVKRREITEKIKVALSFGDLSENAEYDEAKNEQAQMEERIYKLEGQLRAARIINESEIDHEKVTVGSIVKIEIKDPSMSSPEVEEYTIVGSAEADPSQDKISNESPIGSALLGKKAGEKLVVQVPNGSAKIKVISIRR